MASTFQYLSGGTWTTETNYIGCHIKDTLGYPLFFEVTVANSNPANSRDQTYSDYQQVRFLENRTGLILFYGKIEKRDSEYNDQFGQVIKLSCRDNLQELIKRFGKNTYANFQARSTLIKQIVADNIQTSTSIDTTDANKFQSSFQTAYPIGVLDFDFTKSKRNTLEVITGIANQDPWDAKPTSFGFDFYLDAMFSNQSATGTAQPKMYYFKRGTIPQSGAPATDGLTVQYGLTGEGNQTRPMLPDYVFPRATKEIVTVVETDYLTQDNEFFQDFSILVLLTSSTGVFTQGGSVTGAGIWANATCTYDGTGNTSTPFLCLGNTNNSFTSLTIGGTLTDATTGHTAIISSVPRQTYGLDVMAFAGQYHLNSTVTGQSPPAGNAATEARNKAAQILFQRGAGAITRGEFTVVQWPSYLITGTHNGLNAATSLTDTLTTFTNKGIFVGGVVKNATDNSTAQISSVTANNVGGTLSGGTRNNWNTGDTYQIYVLLRAGHSIQVNNSNLTAINGIYTVGVIDYDEGPGRAHARIEVFPLASGVSAETKPAEDSFKDSQTAQWNSIAAVGGVPIGDLTSSSSFTFSSSSQTAFTWTAGTLQLSDGRSYSILAGSSTVAVGTQNFIYFDPTASTTVLQSTTTVTSATGKNKLLVAIASPGTTTSDNASVLTLTGNGSGVINASLLAAKIVLASTIYLSNKAAPGNTYLKLDWTGIYGFADSAGVSVLQWQALNSTGKIQAGGNIGGGNFAVTLDAAGITITAGTSTTSFITFQDSALTIRGRLYSLTAGDFDATRGAMILDAPVTTNIEVAPSANFLYLGRSGGTNFSQASIIPNVAAINLGQAANVWGTVFVSTTKTDTISILTAASITSTNTIIPSGDNTLNLGALASRWSTVYGISINSGASDLTLAASTNQNIVFSVGGTGEVIPTTDNSITLGVLGAFPKRWNNVYTTAINSGAASLTISSTTSITVNTDFLPDTADLRNLGSATLPWTALWLGPSATPWKEFVSANVLTKQAPAGTTIYSFDSAAPVDTNTAMQLRVTKGGVTSLVRVSVGAADSGGVGFRLLAVPN